MQVILTQDVAHLGSLGDEVKVKDGFARNYLLPRGLALGAGSKNAALIAHRKKNLERLRAVAVDKARVESEKVSALELTVRAKAGPSGKLFGSVTNRDLQAALKALGYDLDRRAITLIVPIKNVGVYKAQVKLHSEVKTEITVRVQPIELTAEELKALQAETGESEAAPAAAAPAPDADSAAAAPESAAAEAAPEKKE